jgi:phospho-N-acetylmuramoyl-pentapeptide-transferase
VLYWLLTSLNEYFPTLSNLIRYIAFRGAGAAVTAVLLSFLIGPPIIRRLRAMKVQQGVRQGTPDSHKGKATTPTMGGLILLTAGIIPAVLWTRLDNPYVIIALIVTIWMGGIGFLDDYLKLKQKREGRVADGLVERYKLAGQITIGLMVGILLWQVPLSALPGASTSVPFFKYIIIIPAWPAIEFLYVGWVTFILTGVSNATNLTDGLDGLSAGLCAIALVTFGLFAYVMGRVDASAYLQLFYLPGSGELAVFCLALAGACTGFLWFNAHPAQVFMGDTGALALGGALGSIAILLKSEFLLLFIGGVFAAETFSVILQRVVFKYRKSRYGVEYARVNRLFRKAPLHHHFEMKGWTESQVVVRFWILGILCAFVALTTLKLR